MNNGQLRYICLLVILFGCAGGVCVDAQKSAGRPEKPASRDADREISRERPPEILNLITIVEWSPPEFAADMLITIAESEKVTDVNWKKQLLEEAFHSATDCQYRIPQRAVGPYPTDTRAGFLAMAFGLKLDTLSLQCRAIQSMLPLDKARARQLFSEIERIKFPALSCGDGLVYEVSDFYKTAGNLFKEAFSSEEVRRGDRIRFLESLIEDTSSPLQIVPVANLIRSLEMSRAQRESAVAAFAAKLAKVSGDDRSFSSSIYSADDEIGRLVHVCNEQGVSAIELIKAQRSYYVRHFGSSRCSDTLRNVGDKGLLPHEINEFNARVRALGDKKISEIEADDVKPSKLEGKVDVHFYWESAESAKLMRDFKQLRFGSGLKPLTFAEMDNLQWKLSLREFLASLSNWRQEDDKESAEDYYHQKCNLFEALLGTLPAGPERDDVNRQFVNLLCEFDVKRAGRIEWFWHAKNLLPGKLGKPDGARNANLIALLEASSNTVMYAYVQVWKALSSPASATPPASLPPNL